MRQEKSLLALRYLPPPVLVGDGQAAVGSRDQGTWPWWELVWDFSSPPLQ